MQNIVDINENFEKLILHTPKAIQGGNAYIANISLHEGPVIFQTPKCKCKKGVHKTNKQIYTDLLFTDHDYTFLNWIQNLEKKVQKLIYEKRETWFGGDDDDELTLDDIEHNWMPIIKSYKKKYLVRTYFPKNIKTYSRAVSVYDNEENELSIDSIVGDSNLITILQLGGLKFSPTYFHLELNVRQVMVIKEKELFNKCLIQLNKKSNSEYNEITSVKGDYHEEDEEEDQEEEEDEDEGIVNTTIINETPEKILVVKKEENDIDNNEKTQENVNTLVKNDNNNEISEINLEIPKEEQVVELKKPNEVYLEIYKKAREKAKKARMEAIKAYLTVKEIKKQYLLDEMDFSEDESDEEEFLFSEK
tara:strand:+ start:10913 stop:11998 length:1086 start_codon:yes stop_codon:yes gene_type:complete